MLAAIQEISAGRTTLLLFIQDDVDCFGPAVGQTAATERIHELTGYVQSLHR